MTQQSRGPKKKNAPKSSKPPPVPHRSNSDETKKFLNRLVQEWRVTFDSLADGVLLIDKGSFIIRCNRAMARLLNKSFIDIIGQDCRRFLPELSLFIESLPRSMERRTEVVLLKKRWRRIAADPLQTEAGEVRGWTIILTDIHELRSMEEELRLSEERFRLIFEQSPVGIAIFRWMKLLYVNPSCLRFFGYHYADEVGGTSLWRYIQLDELGGIRAVFNRLKDVMPGGVSLNLTGKKRGGSFFPIHVEMSQFQLSDGPAIMAFIIDRTESKFLEERLAQSQKMESLGQLASGISHDFNNILTGIMGYADMALGSIHPPHPLYDSIHRIRMLTERASSITRKLLTFSRKQVLEPRSLNLNQVISDLLKLLGKTLGESVEIDFQAGFGLKPVCADVSQMEQVLMNLCLNARDAMPNGGRLTIRTANLVPDEKRLLGHGECSLGPYIVLEILDTGSGMEREIMAKIFEPFFTTKEAGKGTGLGLSMVHGIITQQGGFIEVESDCDQGTTFRIFLPAAEAAPDQGKAEERSELSGGGETILVVEDDEDVLDLIQSILSDLGYTLLTAREGTEGLEIFRSRQSEIDLIITDVVMPRFNGRQLQERIVEIDADARILFISGYTANELPMQQPGGSVNFLSKPFTPSQLGTRVREILDR